MSKISSEEAPAEDDSEALPPFDLREGGGGTSKASSFGEVEAKAFSGTALGAASILCTPAYV